ncbi:MAG TPA: hypothetical protein VFE63_11005 [Roseiarcus sp.]|nr:hypothetical protein [Roseiarcus sp.]
MSRRARRIEPLAGKADRQTTVALASRLGVQMHCAHLGRDHGQDRGDEAGLRGRIVLGSTQWRARAAE